MDRSATCPSLWTDTRESSVNPPGTMAAWQDLATAGRHRTRVRWSAPPPWAGGSRAGAQVRSMVVDLLELTGLDQDQALARVPRPG